MKTDTLVYLIDEISINRFTTTTGFMLKKISENFDKVFILNFVSFKNKFNFFINLNKNTVVENNDKSQFKLPKNVKLININTDYELSQFCKNKNVIGIDLLGRRMADLPIHFLLAKNKIKLIQITNIGNIQWGLKINPKYFLKGFKYYFDKKISKIIYYIFGYLCLVPRVEIRFISNSSILESINKNILKKLFYKFRLLNTKKIINVNSISYDQFEKNKKKNCEKYIVLLDHDISSPDDVYLGNPVKINEKAHFKELNIFLKNLSKTFKKKIVIALHPRDQLSKKKKIFSNFKVVKYQTPEYINKAFLVVFFESSAIINAILLKKKIISITSNRLSKNMEDGSLRYQRNVGIIHLNIQSSINFEKKNLLQKLEKAKFKYKNFIEKYIQPDKNNIGHLKIIKMIKKEFFKK